MYLIFDGSIENLEVLFSKSAILVYILAIFWWLFELFLARIFQNSAHFEATNLPYNIPLRQFPGN